MTTQLTTTGHHAAMRDYGSRPMWSGDLHLCHVGERGDARRKLSRYTIRGVPIDTAHIRQDVPRGPWIVHWCGVDITTERTKSDAQHIIEARLNIGWRNQ